MGNGLTVWNRLEEKDGDYVTIAHIAPDRSVRFYDQDMPDNVKERIERIARTSELTVSATQDIPVFTSSPEPELPGHDTAFIGNYGIYQLKDGSEMRDYRFEPLDRLKARGLTVDRGHYELVYRARLASDDTLDRIYQRFNTNHPPDFDGRSLSISDVIVLKKNGSETAYYVDRFGFQEVPAFLAHEKPERLAASEVEHAESEQADNAKLSANHSIILKTSIHTQLKVAKTAAALAQKQKMDVPKRNSGREV